jgi:hypothetical protein
MPRPPQAERRHSEAPLALRGSAPLAVVRSASPGSPGLILAPLATVAASTASRPIAPPVLARRQHVEGRGTSAASNGSR